MRRMYLKSKLFKHITNEEESIKFMRHLIEFAQKNYCKYRYYFAKCFDKRRGKEINDYYKRSKEKQFQNKILQFNKIKSN